MTNIDKGLIEPYAVLSLSGVALIYFVYRCFYINDCKSDSNEDENHLASGLSKKRKSKKHRKNKNKKQTKKHKK